MQSGSPKHKKKDTAKVVYLDTSTLLDVLLKRSDDAPVLWSSVRKRKWKMVTSTVAMMEIADWKKRDVFIRNKIELKWDADNILGKKNHLDLNEHDFDKVRAWFAGETKLTNVDFVELEKDAWLLAREISAQTNLLTKDALHFATALAAARNGECDFLVTTDGQFAKEAQRFMKITKEKKPRILLPKAFASKYPPPKGK